MRTKDQICHILDNAKLTIPQFNLILKNISKFFSNEDHFEILKHIHINFLNDGINYLFVLDSLSQLLNFPLLSEIKNHAQTLITPKSTSTTQENTDKLRGISKIYKSDWEHRNAIYDILNKALQEGDESTIKVSVDENICYFYDSNKNNIIHYAVNRENLKLIKLLQKFGARMDIKNDNGKTILHKFCVYGGNLEGVKFALNFIDINDRTGYLSTPLIEAAMAGERVIDFLLSQPNIDVTAKDDEGHTYIDYLNDKNLSDPFYYNCKEKDVHGQSFILHLQINK